LKQLPIHKNNFDLLRLLGAVLVIYSHSYDIIGKPDQEIINHLTNRTFEGSGIGLSIFFFISGYFITQSAVLSTNFFLFVKKRVYRIYPALIVLVFLSVFIAGPIFTTLSIRDYFSENSTWLYLYTATGMRIRMYLPGVFTTYPFGNTFNASLWSIALEIQLYISISIFLLAGILKNKKVYVYISLSIVVVCLMELTFNNNLSFQWMRYLSLITLFYLGSFIYSSSLNNKHIGLIFLFSFIIYLFARAVIPSSNTASLLLIILGLSTYFIGFTKTIKIPLHDDISYGLYIYAFPIQQLVFKLSGFNRSIIVNLLGTFILLIPIAYISWYFIEKPFLILKNKSLCSSNGHN
jgi:peptidoglycan/LPS O-acetylase OafA/YrhL